MTRAIFKTFRLSDAQYQVKWNSWGFSLTQNSYDEWPIQYNWLFLGPLQARWLSYRSDAA